MCLHEKFSTLGNTPRHVHGQEDEHAEWLVIVVTLKLSHRKKITIEYRIFLKKVKWSQVEDLKTHYYYTTLLNKTPKFNIVF